MALEVLFESTARLVAHPLSYRLNVDNLSEYVDLIRQQVMVAA